MKTCILCPNRVRPQHKLCASCYKVYKNYMHEEWFIELVKLQQKQDMIDKIEGHFINYNTGVNIYGAVEKPIVSSKKSVGRPPTEWKVINEVLEIFDQSVEDEKNGNGVRLSLRGIEKKMDKRVKYLTIRKILLRYRYDTFQRRK